MAEACGRRGGLVCLLRDISVPGEGNSTCCPLLRKVTREDSFAGKDRRFSSDRAHLALGHGCCWQGRQVTAITAGTGVGCSGPRQARDRRPSKARLQEKQQHLMGWK